MLQGSLRWRASSPPWSASQHLRCWNPTLSGTVSEQNDGSICLIAEIPIPETFGPLSSPVLFRTWLPTSRQSRFGL